MPLGEKVWCLLQQAHKYLFLAADIFQLEKTPPPPQGSVAILFRCVVLIVCRAPLAILRDHSVLYSRPSLAKSERAEKWS